MGKGRYIGLSGMDYYEMCVSNAKGFVIRGT